ncbi:MAG: hypothetical protein IJ801_00590 [Lachnospiraceae bacterium]|nr:hypothetical protein [Lachnospiraceae bacterium]
MAKREVISLAGSKNQTKQQTSNKRNTAGRSSGSKQQKKETIREPEEISYASEIAVWVICACMLIVELGNFGLCGFINYISGFFFGIFGMIEYILPLVVMFAAFFYISMIIRNGLCRRWYLAPAF